MANKYIAKIENAYRRNFGHSMMTEDEFTKWEEKRQKGLLQFIVKNGTRYGIIFAIIKGLEMYISENGFTMPISEMIDPSNIALWILISVILCGLGSIYIWASNQERSDKYKAMIAEQKPEESKNERNEACSTAFQAESS